MNSKRMILYNVLLNKRISGREPALIGESAMDAVILDMDGVLVDSEPLHLEAANRVLNRYGAELTEDENTLYLGLDDADFFREMKEKFSIDESVEALSEAREELVLEMIGKGVVPQPGVPELITGLKMRGFLLAVASSSSGPVVKTMLEELGLLNSLDAVVSGDEVEQGKPAPHIFILAADRLGVERPACLVVEDSVNGIKAARAAGMTPVAVRTRDNFRVDLAGAERVFDGLARFDWSILGER